MSHDHHDEKEEQRINPHKSCISSDVTVRKNIFIKKSALQLLKKKGKKFIDTHFLLLL